MPVSSLVFQLDRRIDPGGTYRVVTGGQGSDKDDGQRGQEKVQEADIDLVSEHREELADGIEGQQAADDTSGNGERRQVA